MNKQLALMVAAAFAANLAIADTGSKAALDAAQKRYDDDRKICADEANSSQRMQCLRDSKSEYDKAVAAANASSATPAAATAKTATAAAPAAPCTSCGKVTAVKLVEKQGEGSAAGMIAGGAVGALLGNQIGKGTTRDIATIAGAAGGAYAGKKIEENAKTVKRWDVYVRFDNGDERVFSYDKDPGFSAGTPIKAVGSELFKL
jgi:outer membrane lipoprotein SlyB